MKNQKLKGNLILLLTSFIWGTSFIAQSKGVEEISPFLFNGARSILGGIVLIPVILFLNINKKRKSIETPQNTKTLLIGGTVCGLFMCFATTLQTAGMIYTSPGKSGFITALYMVIIPIISLFMKKKPRPVILLSVLLAVCGLYFMCIDSSLTINKGDVLTLMCAVLFAGHILAIDYFSPRVDGVKLACLQFFVCGIFDLIWVLLFEKPEIKPMLDCWISIGYSGIMSCGVAYTLQIIGQKYTDPTSASIFMSLESVFATLTTVVLVACGWQITGGALTLREIMGCVLMFTAVILVQLPENKKQKNTACVKID